MERHRLLEELVALGGELGLSYCLVLVPLCAHALVGRGVWRRREVLRYFGKERVVFRHLLPGRVDATDLHRYVAEVDRAHLVEHLRLDLAAARAHHLLGDLELGARASERRVRADKDFIRRACARADKDFIRRAYPVVVDERLLVDVCLEHVLVGAEEVDHGVGLGDEHEALALHVEHALRLEVHAVVLGVLRAPGHALGGRGVVLVDDERVVICALGERGEGVADARAGDLLVGDARDVDADGAGQRAGVLDDAGLLENRLREDRDRRLRVASLHVRAQDFRHLACGGADLSGGRG